jgi:hypothetical protein
MATPPNFAGPYSNGGYYPLGTVILADGNPYGIAGAYYIRSGNSNNPGYPPGDTSSWSIYNMPKGIDGAGSITGSGEIA